MKEVDGRIEKQYSLIEYEGSPRESANGPVVNRAVLSLKKEIRCKLPSAADCKVSGALRRATGATEL